MMRTEDSVRWSNSPVGAGRAVSLLHTIPFDSTSGLRKQARLWGAAQGSRMAFCTVSSQQSARSFQKAGPRRVWGLWVLPGAPNGSLLFRLICFPTKQKG